MNKYRVTLLVTVTYDAKTQEDAEAKIDNAVNLREVLEAEGMKIERHMTDVYFVGAVKAKE